ncbi:pantetheine-phosphate adenylyltransferase [Hydrogenophaga sp. IBVHS1]|uniref:pantetheine-phosphate adenylyltransferase n=1 Tax=unclassified Hydrogenophaga TaxID=2610897 RepID=UPI000A2E0094|nr:pantetheine-phosphate adenylyltransferase [Hydrogenophaga sp. IBVHS1]OSZ73456.1 pantetheine-phosphate adenylyltransferase [Hydrogenophaga sp. IBVHS1]
MTPDPVSTARQPRVAVYSGTFDPLTLGHEDVTRRAALLFDEVIVAVAIAHHKKTRFSLQERLDMAAEVAARMPGQVRVLPFEGLIMDFCRRQGACAVVRGIRNLTDFDYEAQMAAMNRKLNPAVETVFLLPQAELQCISSTLVREISQLGGDVSQMVSEPVAKRLKPRPLQA